MNEQYIEFIYLFLGFVSAVIGGVFLGFLIS